MASLPDGVIPSLRSICDGLISLYDITALKNAAYYERVLWRDVRDYYNGEVERGFVEGDMVRLIDEQLSRAWREGAREVGVEPADMTEEELNMVEAIKDDELSHVTGFLDAVEAAIREETGVEQFRARVQLWANRYDDVVNRARVYFGGKVKLEWVMGNTEHCQTCLSLNGIVAYAEEWEQSGFQPQHPDNPMLECHGFNCQCRLEPTNKRRTQNALARLMDLAVSQTL